MAKMLQDSDGNTSSKRIIGVIACAISGIMFGLLFGIALVKKIVDPDTALTCAKAVLLAGTGLLGVGVIERFGNKK